MPVPSGTASLQDIQDEFGGSHPIAISEYYGAAAGVPASGTISINDFRGKSNTFSFTLTSNQQNYDVRAAAVSAGWDGSSEVELTINSGVTVYASSTSNYACSFTGSFPSGAKLINNGIIVGRGGNGGNGYAGNGACYGYAPYGGGSGGGTGGPGLYTSVALSVTNNNRIAGGGGGGGGGYPSNFSWGGSGAGGGLGISSGGSPGTHGTGYGNGGTLTAFGYGGSPRVQSGSGCPWVEVAGRGGDGGTYGAGGSSPGSSSTPGVGGNYITGNSNVTWVVTGTRNGGVA